MTIDAHGQHSSCMHVECINVASYKVAAKSLQVIQDMIRGKKKSNCRIQIRFA